MFNLVHLLSADCVCVQSLGRYTPLHVACSYLPLTVTDRNRWLEDQQKTKIRKLLSLNCDCTLFDKVTITSCQCVCVCVAWRALISQLVTVHRMATLHSTWPPSTTTQTVSSSFYKVVLAVLTLPIT